VTKLADLADGHVLALLVDEPATHGVEDRYADRQTAHPRWGRPGGDLCHRHGVPTVDVGLGEAVDVVDVRPDLGLEALDDGRCDRAPPPL